MLGNIEWSAIFWLVGMIVFIFLVNRYFKNSRRGIFAIAFPALVFIRLSEELLEKELYGFDNAVYAFISKFITEPMTAFMKSATFMGSASVLIFISLVMFAGMWGRRKYRFFGWMILANLSAVSLLDEVFKLIFHRPRPDMLRLAAASGYSFPSGHSMSSMSFYGFLAWLCLKYIRRPYKYIVFGLIVLLVLLIGISRDYLGVHYASDVIAGFAAGMAWLAIFISLINLAGKPRADTYDSPD